MEYVNIKKNKIMVLESQDLRIGDLVTIDNQNSWSELKNIPMIVTGINEARGLNKESTFSISLISDNKYNSYSQFIKFIKPISLTEEWLLKFGFKIEKEVEYVIDIKDFTFKMMFHDCWHIYFKEKNGYGTDQINLTGYWFVHQLQNLYYVLTQKELTLQK